MIKKWGGVFLPSSYREWGIVWFFRLGTIHLGRWQIFLDFWPLPPLTVGSFLLLSVGKFGKFLTPPPLKNADVLNEWSLSKFYHGMTGGPFKSRYNGHKDDMRHKEIYVTTLSRHVWRLREMKVKFGLTWEIKEKAVIYKPGGKDCKLCNAEKYHILMANDKGSLNCRSELLSKCRHRA